MILTQKNLHQRAERIQQQMQELIKQQVTPEQLQVTTQELQARVQEKGLTDVVVDFAFANMGAAIHYVTQKTPYLVQIMAGLVLNQHAIAEMYTGEGKTLTALMPLYANALAGKGAHLITANPYLAERDATENRPIFEALGMTVGFTSENVHNPQAKQQAYACDVTYSTGPGVGFDYLTDNLATSFEQRVQRGLHYALIDEADSILLDEAKTPLIISGKPEAIDRNFQSVNVVVADWLEQQKWHDYVTVNEKQHQVSLTKAGVAAAKEEWGDDVFHTNPERIHVLNELLQAYFLYEKDKDYVIVPDEKKKINTVQLVNETTGRVAQGQRLQNGLHQALETKENLLIQSGSTIKASITYQSLFQLYNKVAGMTGTAKSDQVALNVLYGLDVVSIPTNRPRIRQDLPNKYFRYASDKEQAVLQDVKHYHHRHQPVLLVTGSVSQSERFDKLLTRAHLTHYLLTAKNPEIEAEVVKQSGDKDSILVSTNMAGRGTDIKISEEIANLGGLVVLGTELHDSVRVDDQLRGRAGRQGQPGITQFYGSLEDELFKELDEHWVKRWRKLFNHSGQLHGPLINWVFRHAQNERSFKDFDAKKNELTYQGIINQEQQMLYQQRDWLLTTDQDYLVAWIKVLLRDFYGKHWYLPYKRFKQAVQEELLEQYLVPRIYDLDKYQHKKDLMRFVYEQMLSEVHYKQGLLKERFNGQLRQWCLTTIDYFWQSELSYLSDLKQMVIYQSYRQANPTIEYQRQASKSWEKLLTNCREKALQITLQGILQPMDEGDLEWSGTER